MPTPPNTHVVCIGSILSPGAVRGLPRNTCYEDPALSARLLNLSHDSLMSGRDGGTGIRGGAMLGPLFESIVTLCVQVAAVASDAQVYHLRDRDGRHEIDLIVEGPEGAVVALEVKLATTPDDHDTRHLHWLKNQIGDQLADMAVITTGQYAYRRTDGVAVIPAALLGPGAAR